MLLVAGGSFAISQFVTSNFIDYTLTDVLSSLGSLIADAAVPAGLAPAPDPEFAIAVARFGDGAAPADSRLAGLAALAHPLGVVILWTSFRVFAIGQQDIPWPGLHKAISITLYNDKPYAAIWAFQPLATGTAILLAAIITALVVRLPPSTFFDCVRERSGSSGSRSSL